LNVDAACIFNNTGCDKFLTNMELFTPNPPSTTVNYKIKLSITPNLYARVASLFEFK